MSVAGKHAVGTVLAILAVLVGSLAGASTARASTTSTGLTQIEPVTWVDQQGRQYTLGDRAFALSGSATGQLFVSRDRADGQPDTTWGGDGTGVRPLPTTAPEPGATIDRIASATDDGTITLIWDSAACPTTPGPCDRWFQRVDATGAEVAAPALISDLDPPLSALRDGSVLTGATGGGLGWRGPDGADRGAPEVTASAVRSSSVDAGGGLLVATADGLVHRWPVGGPATTFDSGCAGSTGMAVGAAPSAGDGFAVACGSADQPIHVTRYDGAGAVAWQASDTAAPTSASLLQVPTLLAVTADDHVWVAGPGRLPVSANFPVTATVLASFAPDGTITRPYDRATIRPGNYDNGRTGIAQIRPVDGAHIAMVDLQRCCFTMAGDLPFNQITSLVVPVRPAPPACPGPNPTIVSATESSLGVRFTTCPSSGEPSSDATTYRVEVASTEGTVSVDVAEPAHGKDVTATVTGVPAGRLLTVRVVPSNAVGESVGPASTPARTVAPFRTVDAFADRPYREGGCGLVGLAEGDDQRDLILAGTLDPADHVANVLERCEAEHRIEPVARLYQAAFLRPADSGGLRYWVSRSRAGRSLRSIAAGFAGSSEFTRRYGSLSNRGYVERIYQNVLGRPGDADGIAFWTSRLDRRLEDRGGILAQFSESSEHQRRTDGLIQPTAAWFLMLGRAPNASERTTIATFDEPRPDAVRAIVSMASYAALVAS